VVNFSLGSVDHFHFFNHGHGLPWPYTFIALIVYPGDCRSPLHLLLSLC
jgi:hypothetical protein